MGRTPAALPRPRMQAAVTGGRSAGTARPGRRRRGRLVALITLSGAEAGSEVCQARAAAAWQEDGARPPHSGGGTGPRAGRPGSCRSLEALPAPGCASNFRHPGTEGTSGARASTLAGSRERGRAGGRRPGIPPHRPLPEADRDGQAAPRAALLLTVLPPDDPEETTLLPGGEAP